MLKRLFLLILKLIAGFLIITISWVYAYKYIPIPFTATILSNGIQSYNSGKGLGWSKKWVSLDQISVHYIKAVIASEDQKFLQHNGFDVEAIKKAMKHNKKSKKIRGGSTISQQTAKNAFLWQGRNWLRKSLEVYFTFLIEKIWGKKKIIEVYLNVAEMGKNIYGVEAASQKYFGKSAKDIGAREAALVAAALPSPRTYSVTSPGPYMRKRQAWILKQMNTVHWE